MPILALDTSMEYCSVALTSRDQFFAREALAPRQHAQLILTMIESVLAEANMSLAELDALAFGGGPASFTGIRIAASCTQAIAFAHDLPVIRVSSLAAIAQEILVSQQKNNVVVGIDAFMGEVYWGVYQNGGDGLVRALKQDELYSPEKIHLPDGDWVGVGNAWDKYENLVKPKKIFPAKCVAESILSLAIKKYHAKDLLTAEQAIPVYLRGKDAWRKQL